MNRRNIEIQVIEALRKGIPPQRGVNLYSVGNERLIEGIKNYHLSGLADRGIIRFLSGSWGSGKTHFFRLLREVAFDNNCLVSNVEINVNDAALNKFERVFYSIIRNIVTPQFFSKVDSYEAAPFGSVLREALIFLSTGERTPFNEVSFENFTQASEILFAERSIDIDFKKMVQCYWQTFLPDAPDPLSQERTREEILQWFSGEGSVSDYRKRFEVAKIINKENSKIMFQSLASFVKLSGYSGLVILFDEAEQAYSIMRKSALKDAHNNLLSLINNIEQLTGLFLIYATTPDFFTDPKHGIVIYGALAGRIGKPDQRSPRALDTIWNFDEVVTELSDYQAAAKKIRDIYLSAYPSEKNVPNDTDMEDLVENLQGMHPSLSPVGFWRVLVTALISHLDDCLEGEVRPIEILYDDIMDRLREE
ncbi:MAG: DUF2791 family P-loop domain-containing protein [Anaerolineales bacterium]|nr:DUF2791 family P-loop domain-containing protein [Anaerolineales bacterium]